MHEIYVLPTATLTLLFNKSSKFDTMKVKGPIISFRHAVKVSLKKCVPRDIR